MSAFLMLVPLLLVPVFYALLVKFAAFLVRRTQLSWKNALVFGLLTLAVALVGALANRITGQLLPVFLVGLLGIAIQLAVGGWYLGPRATTSLGEQLGFGRGVVLSLATFGIVFVVGILLAVVLPAVQSASRP